MTTIASDAYEYRGIAWQDLHPIARTQFQELADFLTQRAVNAAEAGQRVAWFRPHMGYRSPGVQAELYAQGRTKTGAKVTNARAWQSAHQFGLAVDFVPWSPVGIGPLTKWDDTVKGRFFWDDNADWTALKGAAQRFGLDCPIKWDRPHVEHPQWNVLREAIRGS